MTVHVPGIRGSTANVDCVPLVEVTHRSGAYRAGFKRVLDLTLVVASLPFVLPVLALIALIIRASGLSPFYRQERIGKDGRRFQMIKFRTMVDGAEHALHRYLARNPEARVEWLTKQKLSQDPRITRLGRALRRTSLDELPQIFNVLKGDMSLVGPRPMMPAQQALYPGQSYYELRPGITGSWQVSSRNECEFAARATYDDAYAREMSLAADARILAQTVGAVLRGTGC